MVRIVRQCSPAGVQRVVVVLLLLAGSQGCSAGPSETSGEGRAVGTGTPSARTVPGERSTPFCRAMIDLVDELESDPAADVEAMIIETYESILDEVPEEIRAEFVAVLAELRGDPSGATNTTEGAGATSSVLQGGSLPPDDPLSDEGFSPDDDPALRVNAYVDFTCRDVANNPGPPATEPMSDS